MSPVDHFSVMRTAHHEAGHVVAFLRNGRTFNEVVLYDHDAPRGPLLGQVCGINPVSAADLLSKNVSPDPPLERAAGVAAEAYFCVLDESREDPYSEDEDVATGAYLIVPSDHYEIGGDRDLISEAVDFVATEWSGIARIAAALNESSRLSYADCQDLL